MMKSIFTEEFIQKFFTNYANKVYHFLTCLIIIIPILGFSSCDKEDELLGVKDGNDWEYSPDDSYDPYTPDNNNGSSKGKAPVFTNFSSTATTNSITVYFYFKEKPTSGTIYYGKNSPSISVKTLVAGKSCSATISNLSPSTAYCFKCIAKNSYGSTTTPTFTEVTWPEPW